MQATRPVTPRAFPGRQAVVYRGVVRSRSLPGL